MASWGGWRWHGIALGPGRGVIGGTLSYIGNNPGGARLCRGGYIWRRRFSILQVKDERQGGWVGAVGAGGCHVPDARMNECGKNGMTFAWFPEDGAPNDERADAHV